MNWSSVFHSSTDRDRNSGSFLLQSNNQQLSAVTKSESVHPDLLWELGRAKLDGRRFLQTEEFLDHVLLLLLGDQAGEEGKQDHRAAQVPVVVLFRLQSCLSQNFINRLELTIFGPSGLNVWVL